MGAMSSVAAKLVLNKADLAAGVAEIELVDTVQRWSKRNKPAGDIQMETPNVMNCVANRPGYRAMRDRLCHKYKTDEFTLVSTLLQHMANA